MRTLSYQSRAVRGDLPRVKGHINRGDEVLEQEPQFISRPLQIRYNPWRGLLTKLRFKFIKYS
jgi:hypothetical protein